MIVYMESTIALINSLPQGEARASWMKHLDGRLQFIQGKDVAYYRFIEN